MDAVIKADKLVKRFGRHKVLDHVSFEALPSTMVGIVGENGSGKTTLLKIIAGALAPDEGEIAIHGALGYCPQQAVLNESLTVLQHLEYFMAAYRLTNIDYAMDLVERLSYHEYLDRPVRELSGGTQQKLNLTLALMHRPALLLLDEPYQGFDWDTYLRFWKLSDELRNDGCCLLIISHLIFDKTRFDSIYQLHDGHLRPENTISALTEASV